MLEAVIDFLVVNSGVLTAIVIATLAVAVVNTADPDATMAPAAAPSPEPGQPWPPRRPDTYHFEKRKQPYRRSWTVRTLITILALAAIGGGAFWALSRTQPGMKTVYLKLQPLHCVRPHAASLVIFLHGWNGSADTSWGSYPTLACADHGFTGTDVLIVNFATYMARRNLRITQIADFIREQGNAQGYFSRYSTIVVVAHSMGGLVARQLNILQTLAGQSGPSLLVEAGTPHIGADPAAVASVLGISRELTEDIASGSSFLSNLQTQWNSMRSRAKTYCVAAAQDAVVSEASALAGCDTGITLPGLGHSDLVKPEAHNDARYAIPMARVRQAVAASSAQ